MRLRTLFLLVYGAVFVVVIALATVAILLFLNQEHLERSQRDRLQSYLLANELRQSGQELTLFARAFAATGDPWFEQCFHDVLAVRNGLKPRPEHYAIYWDFIAAKKPPPRGFTDAVPLQTLLKQAGITDAEFAKLNEAQSKSDALTATEQIAMNARKGLFDDGTGHFTRQGPPDRDLALRLLHDQAYNDAIADIRKPIDDFFGMIDVRTTITTNHYSEQSRIYLWTILGCCGSLVVLMLWALILVQIRIRAPVQALLNQTGTLVSDAERLAKVTGEIASGQLDKSFVVQAKPLSVVSRDEIGELSNKHDEMVTRLQETGSAIATITTELSTRGTELQAAQRELEEANLALRQSAGELEKRVASRTAELTSTNQELQKREETMRENQRLLHAIIDNSTAAIFVKDAEGRYLLQNRQCVRLLQPSSRQKMGTTDYDYFPKELAETLRATDRLVMQSDVPLEREEQLVFDGRTRTYLSIKSALRDEAGNVYGICGIATDITALKEAEAFQIRRARHSALRAEVHAAFSKAEGSLQKILQNSAEALVKHLDAAFARIWILSSQAEILELQASAGVYTNLDGAHSKVAIGHLKIGRIALERAPHLTNDVQNDKAISDPEWARREAMVAFAGYPLLVEGKLLGVLAMFARKPLERDTLEALEVVSDTIAVGIERRRAEDQVRENERRLRLLTETIPGMIWSATPNGEIDYCNQQILSYTGKVMSQLKGVGWVDVIHPDDVPMMRESWRSALSGETFLEAEFRHRRADGAYRWCLSRGLPLRDETGVVVRWYGFITDLDDWRKAQDALRKAEADLAHVTRVTTMGEMMSSISHEINQPLGSIANYGNAARRFLYAEPKRLEDVDRALAHVVAEAERASAVISRIRALAKKTPPERAPLRIEEVLSDVLALARRELTSRLVEVRTHFSSDLPPVMGDRIQLQQVVLNLVMNGADAMSSTRDRKRALTVRAEGHVQASSASVVVSVQDSGTGLPPEEMDQIFTAFYTTKPQGMGLGLAISRTIVEAHGGRLWVEANDGPGVTFKFSVPVAV